MEEQLRHFAGRDLDPEVAESEYLKLMAQSHAYIQLLEGEIGQLDEAREVAAKAMDLKTQESD